MRGMIAALGAICLLTGFSLTACSPGSPGSPAKSGPAAGIATSATASAALGATAVGAANVKLRKWVTQSAPKVLATVRAAKGGKNGNKQGFQVAHRLVRAT